MIGTIHLVNRTFVYMLVIFNGIRLYYIVLTRNPPYKSPILNLHTQKSGILTIPASMEDSVFKVLMFPWLAHGHISPFIELSKKLITKKNFHIYFYSTKINLTFAKKHVDDALCNHSIEFVELQFPDSSELPPHYHTTKNLPPHLMSKLMRAFQMSKPSFSNIINTLRPDLLIYDGFQSWAPTVAAENNIPAVHFVTSGAATMSFFYHQHAYTCLDSFPSSSIFLRDHEKRKLKALVESNKAVAEDFAFRCFELSSEIILIKTCRDIEDKYLDHLSFLCGKELVALGPLVQESNCQEENDQIDIVKFLNNKNQSSVVFVSFGSEYFLSKEEREEIAYGLELSNVNFIWVVRFPMEDKISIKEAVPKGFLDRIKDRGMVVDGWAPQAKILEHTSTGGFVSHCGWSSVMESLYFGVPLIAMPMHLDQPTNARLLVEIGVAMEVLKDENGKINREEVANVIKTVVLEKPGEGLREKAREAKKKLRLKGEEELQGAVEKVWNLCSKKKHSNGSALESIHKGQAPATVVG